jgi:membrane-associated protease RseP (regulator of RpoE activity)
LAKSSDLQLAIPALERLILLKDRGEVASKAAEQLAMIRHQQAADTIVKLGGHMGPVRSGLVDPRFAPVQVVLDANWKGGDDGLSLLQDIRGLVRVAIIGTDLSFKGLAKLEAARGLQMISLYGTRVANEDVNELRKLIPNVTVDVRKGGLLGIRGDSTTDRAAHVVQVQPEGAAQEAGIQAGDSITHLNMEELANFEALVSRVANMSPGDVVSLRVNRNGKVMDLDVRLGQWNADDVLKN